MISFGSMLARQRLDLVHVDAMRLTVDAVGDRLEPAARHVDRRAVGEMPAGREVEPHEGVAGLHQRHEHALIGLAAGIRLDVGEAAGEQLAGALDRQIFRDVDELAAAVIAPAGIPFGVFVGHHRALRLQNRARDDVLRGDQLDLVALAAEFELDGARDFGIGVGEGGGKERIGADRLGERGVGHGRRFRRRCVDERRASRPGAGCSHSMDGGGGQRRGGRVVAGPFEFPNAVSSAHTKSETRRWR